MKIKKSTKGDIALAIFMNSYKIIYYFLFTFLGLEDIVALVIVGFYLIQSIVQTLDRWEMEMAFDELDSHLDDCLSLIDSLEEDLKDSQGEIKDLWKEIKNIKNEIY